MQVGTPGGGGYGDPLERDPALVRRDVAMGYYTAEQAENCSASHSTRPMTVDRESTAQAAATERRVGRCS